MRSTRASSGSWSGAGRTRCAPKRARRRDERREDDRDGQHHRDPRSRDPHGRDALVHRLTLPARVRDRHPTGAIPGSSYARDCMRVLGAPTPHEDSSGALGLGGHDRDPRRGSGVGPRRARSATTPAGGHDAARPRRSRSSSRSARTSRSRWARSQLFDQKGDRVDIGAPHHSAASDDRDRGERPAPRRRRVRRDVARHLGRLASRARRVHLRGRPRSSADAAGLAARLEAKAGGNRTVGVIFAIARALEFAGIALLDRWCRVRGRHPPARPPPIPRRRARVDRLDRACSSRRSSRCCSRVRTPTGDRSPTISHIAVVRAVLQTRYGHIVELRLVLLLAALPLLFVVRKSWRPPGVVVGAGRADRPR